MKGVINKGIAELVESRWGADAWERVKAAAGCDEPFFAVSEDYPDAMTLALARAAADVAGMSLDDVLVELGTFWVTHTGKENHSAYYQLAGGDARTFLRNVQRIHDRVTHGIANAHPPRFECEDAGDGRLRMHYFSDRGFCPAVRGLILGVGLHFGETLAVREIACTRRGAPHCIMEITFGG